MRTANINVFIDEDEVRGLDLKELFVRIEESKVAIVIFSKNFTSSNWCLNELARIKNCVDRGTLIAIPIFYQIKPSVVKGLEGDFGTAFETQKNENGHNQVTKEWEEAILSISRKHGMELLEHGHMADSVFINDMIKEVKRLLEHIKKKADQIIRQPESVQNRQPEAVPNRQAVQIQEPKVNHQGCMFNARQLRINNSHNAKNWTYVSISESPNESAIEVAKMVICYDLEVRGEFHTKELSFGKRYEVVFVVKIENTMSGFDILAKTQLMVPDDNKLQEHELQFVDLVKNEWVEIRAGVFDAWPHKEKIAFYLYQDGSEKKMTGLLVKSAIIRPVKPEIIQNRQPKAVQIQPPNVNHKGCMFNARQLKINNSHNARYWTYVSISESPNESAIEVAEMVVCYDIKVRGEFHTKELTFGKRYEVVFVVKIENTMSRFDILAKTQLMVPDDNKLQEHELQFVDLVKNEWVEIRAGVFDAWPHKEKIAFYLYQDGSEKKMTGLLVKSAIIRPVKPEVIQNRQPKAVQIQPLNVNHQGFMFNARQLKINNSHNARYWTYVSISESPNEAPIEVAKMVVCYDIKVRGEFHTKELTSGRRYEVVFVVKIEDTMSRFDILAKTQLMVPHNELQEQELQFVDLIKNEWIEIRAGVFDALPHKEKIVFYLYQDGSEEKMTGLLIKSAIIRPIIKDLK